jgi:hypothetical protein
VIEQRAFHVVMACNDVSIHGQRWDVIPTFSAPGNEVKVRSVRVSLGEVTDVRTLYGDCPIE